MTLKLSFYRFRDATLSQQRRSADLATQPLIRTSCIDYHSTNSISLNRSFEQRGVGYGKYVKPFRYRPLDQV